MIVEEYAYVLFDETNHTKQDSLKKSVEENDQNTILHKLNLSPKK